MQLEKIRVFYGQEHKRHFHNKPYKHYIEAEQAAKCQIRFSEKQTTKKPINTSLNFQTKHCIIIQDVIQGNDYRKSELVKMASKDTSNLFLDCLNLKSISQRSFHVSGTID